MNVEVTLNDNSKIYPSYDPQHKAEVIGFYTKAYWNLMIQGYRITLSDGSIINLGTN
jgi:hypothetical protein